MANKILTIPVKRIESTTLMDDNVISDDDNEFRNRIKKGFFSYLLSKQDSFTNYLLKTKYIRVFSNIAAYPRLDGIGENILSKPSDNMNYRYYIGDVEDIFFNEDDFKYYIKLNIVDIDRFKERYIDLYTPCEFDDAKFEVVPRVYSFNGIFNILYFRMFYNGKPLYLATDRYELQCKMKEYDENIEKINKQPEIIKKIKIFFIERFL